MVFKRLLIAAVLILFAATFASAKKQKAGGVKTAVESKVAAQAKDKGKEKAAKKDDKKAAKKQKDKKNSKAADKSASDDAAASKEQTEQANDSADEEDSEENPEENWQILEWEDENSRLALRYDVIIEQRDKRGKFLPLLKLETKDNTTQVKIEPPLKPGFYRYSVVSYNLFGVAKAQSDWEEFPIYRAYKPRVTDVSVDVNLSSNIYLDYKNDGIISFGGRNLFMPPEGLDDTSFTNYVLRTSAGRVVKPLEILEHSDNDRKIQFKFDLNDLDVGKYSLLATDASGLTNDSESGNLLTVRFKKWMDFNISAGYVCPIVLFDDTISEYFETTIFPLGGTARMTWFPFKRRWGNLGVGISASYTWMKMEKQQYSLNSNLATAHLYFAYSHPFFNKRLSLEAHVGAGVTALLGYYFEFENNIKSDPQTSMNISAMAGAAAQVFVFKRLYVELCADFVMFFIPDDMTFGAVLPSASVGWQF